MCWEQTRKKFAFFPKDSVTCSLKASTSGVIGREAGGRLPPETFNREFLQTYREKRGKEKRKTGKIKQNCKKKVEIENGRKKVTKWGEDFYFLFHFILFYFFGGCTKVEIFYREKTFTPGKKSGKMTLLLMKIFLLRPWLVQGFTCLPNYIITDSVHNPF